MKKIALAGNPNCGKTTLFNALTGSTAHVGNWPGVTVDKKEGIYKKSRELLNIVDLPGIYSLSPYTSEEVISRNFILFEKPDAIINVVDATNLERNLYLTTQLLEIDVPVIIALNMMDILDKRGEKIDISLLSKKLGVPVIGISAQKEDNLKELMDVTYEESLKPRKAKSILRRTSIATIVDKCEAEYESIGVDNPLFHAIKLIEMDDIEVNDYPNLVPIVKKFKESYNHELFGFDLEAFIADARYKEITNSYIEARLTKKATSCEPTSSDKADKIMTHKWLGIPIFLFILFLVFHLTFSENLFFLGKMVKFNSPSFAGSLFEGLLWTEAGVNSPGVILFNLLDSITSGINDAIREVLASQPGWVVGLLCDGILGGLFAVIGFLPQILVLFLFFSILEDSGYMARVAFILDRLLRKFGLSGRAFLPMIMGFGCSIPAMINTRTLADDKEKLLTIRVIPFFSCGAKLPILLAIAGAIVSMTGLNNPDVITYSMYVLGMTIAIIAVIVMRHTTAKGEVAPFIMELPSYHMPQFKSLMLHLWDKCKHFIQKAFTIILASTIVIWVLQSFTFDWKYIESVNVSDLVSERFEEKMQEPDFRRMLMSIDSHYDGEITLEEIASDYLNENNEEIIKKYDEAFEAIIDEKLMASYREIVTADGYHDSSDSILAGIGKLIQPMFTPLGFGSNLNKNGWVFGVSAIAGLIAKENVVATFSVLAECQETVREGDAKANDIKQLYLATIDSNGTLSSLQMVNNAGIDSNSQWPILISFIIFNMTTIPCMAAVATAKAELKKGTLKYTILFWIFTSYIASSTIYVVLSWWWTVFIYLALAIAIGILIHFKNKHKSKRIGA